MMKFCLCFHKKLFLGNYFSVLFQAIIYVFSFKKSKNDCKIFKITLVQIFVH